MTTGSKLHQTLISLEGAANDLKTYALDTEDKTAKSQFSQYAEQLDQLAENLAGRVNYIEQQEPQYKVFQQAQEQNKQQ